MSVEALITILGIIIGAIVGVMLYPKNSPSPIDDIVIGGLFGAFVGGLIFYALYTLATLSRIQ